MVNYRPIATIFFAATILLACEKNTHPLTGQLNLQFQTEVDGAAIRYDVLDYENVAGNTYEVNEVKYFLSRVTLHHADGSTIAIAQNNGIHYYDSNLPTTHNWLISDKLPIGNYTAISFLFGLDEQQNHIGFFVNPPENNMAWPDVLGGGYHYMQINGKWLNESNLLTPFNLHTGIGQRYENGEITEFVHNYFSVTLPISSLTLTPDEVATLTLSMNVNQWFSTPYPYDFNEWGGGIMQNQAAQELLKENGKNVFSVTRLN